MIKLKQRLIIYMSGILFLLAGCAQEGFYGNNPGADDDPLTFSFLIDGITTNSTTRAAISPELGETTVKTLHLLFFEATDDQSGKIVGWVPLPGDPGNPVGTTGQLTMETSYVLPNTVQNGIKASQAYNIIGIANIEDYVDFKDDVCEWFEQFDGVTEAYFRDNAKVEVYGTDIKSDYESYRPIKFDKLLMNGYVKKSAHTKNIQMVLKRNVARFDVVNKSTATPLETISIWNAFSLSSITGDAIFNYASESLHTKRFYGIETDGNVVTGGLYAFANYSEAPSVNDKTTTCLIVGLKKDGSTRYYRININAAGTTQLLKSNYAYNITILTVTGDGYATEEEAWEGTTNQLVYVVNNWNLDDNGLIVSDEFSLLAVPVKTVKIGKEGGESSYSITTFSTLENPEPLRIKSTLFDPSDGNITARIVDGNLVINALAMNTGEEKRSGIITISYAGLETFVNVMQTADAGTYLEVTLDDGWKEFLPPTANAMTENIFVKASGPWTARVYGSKNFSLQNSLNEYVTQIPSSDCPYNKFHVYTSASNESKTVIEKGFVLISLDSDPTNYISVVPVNQSPKGGIGTDPANLSQITFAGNGDCLTTGGVTGSDAKRYRFYVSSTGTISSNNVRLTGVNYDMFNMEYDEVNKCITVSAKGQNNSSSSYTATISVSDNKNGNLLVSLVQGTLDLNVTAPTSKVPATGGESGIITITTGSSISKWKATMTVTGVSGNIVNHGVTLYNEDGSKLQNGDETDQNLYVLFDKVYFPNRETEIKATITISTSGSSKTVDVIQEALISKGLHIWNVKYSSTDNPYGNYNSQWIKAYRDAIIYDSFVNGSSSHSTVETAPAKTTYAHFANHGIYDNFNWTNLENFRTQKEGIVVMCVQAPEINALNTSTSPLNEYNIKSGGHAGFYSKLESNITDTRIGCFLTTNGKDPIPYPSSVGNFYTDAIHTSAGSLPSTAIPIMRHTYEHSASYGRVIMAIDPVRRVVYMGESEIFGKESNLSNDATGGTKKFMNNFIQFVVNTAKYGSHFTDMMIDANTDIEPPYSTYWGTNAWPIKQ